jgi:hypothetical protein
VAKQNSADSDKDVGDLYNIFIVGNKGKRKGEESI